MMLMMLAVIIAPEITGSLAPETDLFGRVQIGDAMPKMDPLRQTRKRPPSS